MDAGFVRAFMPVHAEILGYKLRDLCSAHIVALTSLESPFVEGDRAPTADEVLHFLRVCSTNPLDPDVSPRRMDWLRRALLRLPRVRAYIVGEIQRYIGACSNHPKYWVPDSNSEQTQQITAPQVLASAAYLMCNASLPWRDAMTMRVDLLAWLEGAIAEQLGAKLTFDDEGENAAIRRDLKAWNHGKEQK